MKDKCLWYPFESNKNGESFETEVMAASDFLVHFANNEYWSNQIRDKKSILNQVLALDGWFTIVEDKVIFASFKEKQGLK